MTKTVTETKRIAAYSCKSATEGERFSKTAQQLFNKKTSLNRFKVNSNALNNVNIITDPRLMRFKLRSLYHGTVITVTLRKTSLPNEESWEKRSSNIMIT
mmetsp:Transcript_24614/g.52437  ORF Transcript_24614/g.52437 Transcript_24614/m.52437 type:complete len:100 (-) Transcript_24614:306-605(-)